MTDEVKPSAPMGGSELILANLRRALPEFFPVFEDPTQDKVQVIVSRPQQVTLEDKPRVLWLQDLPNDPASACLADPTYRTQFNRIVCVSHWQMAQYNAVLRIPFNEMVVIKNAVPRITPQLPKPKEDGKLRFIYTSTPHRGLAILGAVAEHLARERQDWQLDVYSSLNIYGWHEQDKAFQPLYDLLRKNPCIVYHGSQPNEVVRQAVLDAHVFVYPSVYMETSCMAIQEALMAGCLAITTNLAALPETCAEWAWMFPVDQNGDVIAERTLAAMRTALDRYDDPNIQKILEFQSLYYQNFWSFETRVPLWQQLLGAVLNEGKKDEEFVID